MPLGRQLHAKPPGPPTLASGEVLNKTIVIDPKTDRMTLGPNEYKPQRRKAGRRRTTDDLGNPLDEKRSTFRGGPARAWFAPGVHFVGTPYEVWDAKPRASTTELHVLAYITRHTLWKGKTSVKLRIKDFLDGRINGSEPDKGANVGRTKLFAAIKSLRQRRWIDVDDHPNERAAMYHLLVGQPTPKAGRYTPGPTK